MRTLTGLCSLCALLLSSLPAHAQTPPPGGLRVCVDSDAYLKTMVTPDTNAIPDVARFSGRSSGSVTVLVSLDQKGGILATSVAKSDSPFLNGAATEAARKSTYAPATHGCEPVKSQYAFVVQFGSADQVAHGSETGKQSASTYSSANNPNGSTSSRAPSKCTPGPAYVKSAQPPAVAFSLTQPGAATIHVTVDKQGTVKTATPVKSDLPQPYADAALQMVKTATFSPKYGDDCKPLDDELDVSIGFHP